MTRITPNTDTFHRVTMMRWNSMVGDSALEQKNKTAVGIFKVVKNLNKEVPNLKIPKAVIDRTHRIGLVYNNKKTYKHCSLFCHRAAFYRALSCLGNRAQIIG